MDTVLGAAPTRARTLRPVQSGAREVGSAHLTLGYDAGKTETMMVIVAATERMVIVKPGHDVRRRV